MSNEHEHDAVYMVLTFEDMVLTFEGMVLTVEGMVLTVEGMVNDDDNPKKTSTVGNEPACMVKGSFPDQ